MKGYKVFNPDWTCRDFKYAVGQTYEMEGEPICCDRGFHFCTDLKNCFDYYKFDPNNKVAVVEAIGAIDTGDGKSCTNKITIVEEITWEEVLRLVNTGKGCSGLCNSGNGNSGNWNSGNWNSGNWNSGNCNSGNRNSGNWNSGNRNSGNRNSGNGNSGNGNSGNWNSGNWNSGNGNSGNWNSGNWNSGNGNSGDWNKTSFSSGVFNTEEGKILMFNKPSDWAYRDWCESKARYLLNQIKHDLLEWVCSNDMTDAEKEQHPDYKTTGGYLKILDESECVQKWWNALSNENKLVFMALPNFDMKIFEEITGIKTA